VDGLKLIPGTPVLEADQLKLRLFELFVKETKHTQAPAEEEPHC
jgi:hypothetical protein